MDEIVLATGNAGKIAELQAILAPTTCISQKSLGIKDVEETGWSFIENAILKARHACQISGKMALADDSGLVVEALDGRPGIFSARFAGVDATSEDNIDKLLRELEGFSTRHAYFYCAIACLRHADDPTPIIATGRLDGEITTSRMGTSGFGYDPVFFVPEHNATLAQLTATQKNTISHRARALQELSLKIK